MITATVCMSALYQGQISHVKELQTYVTVYLQLQKDNDIVVSTFLHMINILVCSIESAINENSFLNIKTVQKCIIAQ